MPWRRVSVMSLRYEFVSLAQEAEVSFSELCRRSGISRRIGYKWLSRYRRQGVNGLVDRSRRPHRIRGQVAQATEEAIVHLREQHPSWGARKIRRRLQDLGLERVPACSTITAMLHRHGLIDPERPAGRRDWQRFEHRAPNSLWQMDFKGPVTTRAGSAHPLTMLDDHSRFNLCLRALPNEQTAGVKEALVGTFRRYGLPDRLLVDNGGPWGSDVQHPYTPLTAWLIRLGISVSHSRPYHPQTLGKDERFHGTLKRELTDRYQWRDLAHLQTAFDSWRRVYNFERPHEAVAMAVPATRYQASLRSFPERLPAIEYPSGVEVRKVQEGGRISFRGHTFRVSKAFRGYPVGLRPTRIDGVLDVLFCHQVIAQISLPNIDKP